MSIAHQIVAKGGSWKTYQESLPPTGADGVDVADGVFSDLNSPSNFGVTDGVVGLYAVKHNPFAYFLDIENGTSPGLSLSNVVSFDGNTGLFADLYSGRVPTFSYIVPNQCNDQHGLQRRRPPVRFRSERRWDPAGSQPGIDVSGGRDATEDRRRDRGLAVLD
jgi:phosphatidylinositol-3-phosphatase